MSTEMLFYSIAGLIVFLCLLYYVIKWGVSAGIKSSGIYTTVNMLRRLKMKEMRSHGIENAEISEALKDAIHD